jgi:hypothetical protein
MTTEKDKCQTPQVPEDPKAPEESKELDKAEESKKCPPVPEKPLPLWKLNQLAREIEDNVRDNALKRLKRACRKVK